MTAPNYEVSDTSRSFGGPSRALARASRFARTMALWHVSTTWHRRTAAGSPRAPPDGSTSAMPGRRCSAGSGPARRAASSCSGSRTSTPRARGPSSPRRSSPISTGSGSGSTAPPRSRAGDSGCTEPRSRSSARLAACTPVTAPAARSPALSPPHTAPPTRDRVTPERASASRRTRVPSARESRPPAWRFRPREGLTEFRDRVHGAFVQDVAAEVGDFVVLRNDGVPSYQLAVVVDDAATGITHVLRGDDLLASTPRQIQLCEALGLPVPAYAHVPLLLGPDGKRLAKRAGTPSLGELRDRAVPRQRLIGLLAGWAGLADGRPVSLEELVPELHAGRPPATAGLGRALHRPRHPVPMTRGGWG